MERLNRAMLESLQTPGLEIGPRRELPVKAMQFGEGNFLRAFIDWMINEMNKQGKFNGMVQLVQPRRVGRELGPGGQDAHVGVGAVVVGAVAHVHGAAGHAQGVL